MPETTMAAVDGRDALAFVIIRPGAAEGAVSIEAAANGLSKQAAAYVLRSVADMWDAETAPTSDGPSDAEQPVTIPAATACHVLWATGHGGYPPGDFTGRLLLAWDQADETNAARLAAGWPDYAAALDLLRQTDGIEQLLAIAAGPPQDDELERREPCGEGMCRCYGVGPDHATCACGCDCPRDDDGQLIED